MRRVPPMLVVVLAVIAYIGVSLWAIRKNVRDSLDYQQKVHVADSLRVAAADSAKAAEAHAAFVVDSLTQASAKKDADLARYRQQLAAARHRVDSVVVAAPDTCQPYLAVARAAVDSAKQAADSIGGLYEQEKAATGRLMVANQGLQGALDVAQRALDASHTAIKAAPHQSFLQKLLPKPGFGGFAGVCTDGRPCAGVGVHAGWNF